MKKLFYTSLIGSYLLTGCAYTEQQTEIQNHKKINLSVKYGINESALMQAGENFIFVIPDFNTTSIYKLDNNYNLIWKKSIPIALEIVKSQVKNNKLYILGYDKNKDKVAFLTYDINGKLEKITYYAKKYSLAKDFIVTNKNIYIAVTQYNDDNNSDIIIYDSNGKTITFFSPNMDDVNFIKPYKKGLLIVGTTLKENEDVLIVYKTFENKTIWAKTLDLGMDEKPLKVYLKNNKIILEVTSTDSMGAQTDVTFTIDENGKINSIKKGVEFKQLPLRYRT